MILQDRAPVRMRLFINAPRLSRAACCLEEPREKFVEGHEVAADNSFRQVAIGCRETYSNSSATRVAAPPYLAGRVMKIL
jgi:hypothetical protein